MTADAAPRDPLELKALLQFAIERLTAAGVDQPRLDAELLLASAANSTRERLLTGAITPDDGCRRRFLDLVEKRVARMPLAYLLGRREFYSLEFEVSPEVLIPRPETETLVAAALAIIGGAAPRIIDLGTGPGTIALAIAANAPRVRVVATDISAGALAIARRNAARMGLGDRVELRRADCWTALDDAGPLGCFDLIVSNPPYIRDADLAALAPEVRDYEPRLALAAGSDGLELYRRIAAGAPVHLNHGGELMVEVGQGQAPEVAAVVRAAGFTRTAVHNDLAGIERVVEAHLPR